MRGVAATSGAGVAEVGKVGGDLPLDGEASLASSR